MIKVLNKEYKERVEKFLERQHFMKHINFSLNVIEPGETRGELIIEEIHKQQKGMVHGGVIATVADITMGFAAYTALPKDYHVVTGELKVSYLNPGMGDKLWARGFVLKQGKKINFCESEIFTLKEGKETLIAKASSSMVTIFPDDLINKE